MTTPLELVSSAKTALTVLALQLTMIVSGCSTTGDQSKNMLGYGYEVTQVSNLIYRIDVTAGMNRDTAETRNVAMAQASTLALSKGYPKFQIIGGDGFRKVSRRVQAGPVPVPLPSEPRGSLVIKLLEAAAPADPDIYDAAAEQERLRGVLSKQQS